MFQLLKRHFRRYTPELVEQVCGVPREQFLEVAEALCANSGKERTSAFCYAVGWTHHANGVQFIRTAAIVQLLLGNMGRPGGGIMALRGHASIQGSTDIPTLYNLLPGYLPMPIAGVHDSLGQYLDDIRLPAGFWGRSDTYMVSLLKAWFGDRATAANDFCFDHLPKLTGDHSIFPTVMAMLDGTCKGFFVPGENPAVGSPNAGLHRKAMARLDWLVVRELVETETASFWYNAPEIETGELRTEDIGTEVFLLPAAAHTEKDGTFTNTQRLLQWHRKAVEPVGDQRSELWFYYHLGRRIREKLAASSEARDAARARPGLGVPDRGPPRRAERRGGAARDRRGRPRRPGPPRVPGAAGRRLDRLRLLDLLGGLRRRGQPGRPAQARVRAELGRPRVGLGLALQPAHPLQPGLGRPRGPALVGAQALCVVGPRPRAAGPGTTTPTSGRPPPPATTRPTTRAPSVPWTAGARS